VGKIVNVEFMKIPLVRIIPRIGSRIAGGLAGMLIPAIGLCQEPVDYANPMIGTSPSGHTYPGATVPFGMVQLSPDTRFKGWDGCSGYDYDDDGLFGFSFNHLTGTGAIDLGNFRFMPIVGELKLDPGRRYGEGYCARFSHDQEKAFPGYYQVLLPDSKVKVELTATMRVGVQRHTFLEKTNAHVLLDLWQGVGNQADQAVITIENDHTISGYRREDRHTFGGSKTYYFVAEFSRPFDQAGINVDGNEIDATNATGHKIIAHFDYATKAGEKLVIKLALSNAGIKGARKNLEAELPGWDFDAVVKQARDQWNRAFNKVQITSEDKNLLQTFYTALYHTEIAPTVFSDVDGRFCGPDGNVHQGGGFDYYTSLSVWDTFRAEQSLLTLTEPRRVNDIIRTMLAQYKILGEHSPAVNLAGLHEACCSRYGETKIGNDSYNFVHGRSSGIWRRSRVLHDQVCPGRICAGNGAGIAK
jgi:predicted alpha-1,2-mannosidase